MATDDAAERARRSNQPSPSPAKGARPVNVKPRNPLDAHKAQLEKLFVDPSREIHIPNPPKKKTLAPPREMIPNVQGSSAGAGSGEFHVYKQSRRREYERLKLMDEDEEREKAAKEFEERKRAMREADEARTAKNRAKRLKKKEKAKAKSKKKGADGSKPHQLQQQGEGASNESGSSDTSDDDDEDGGGEGRQKKRRLANGAPGSILFRGQDEREQDDDMPREEEIKVKRIEEAISKPEPGAPVPAAPQNGIAIVDDD